MPSSLLSNPHIGRYGSFKLPGKRNRKWTVLVFAAAFALSACNLIAFKPEAKAEQILAETGASRYGAVCRIQEFKLFEETQICVTHTTIPRELRAQIDSLMRWSRARPKTDWEPMGTEESYYRRYSYGSGGVFGVALSPDTMLITYHEVPETWDEEVLAALPDEAEQMPVPMVCMERPCSRAEYEERR